MKIKIFILSLFVLWFGRVFPQDAGNIQLSKRIANYDIEVKFEPDSNKLFGKEILYWQNPSNDVIYELRFHLYMNAFKNSKSTFSIEGGNRGGNTDKLKDGEWGWIKIKSFKPADGEDLTGNIKFIQPDDDNAYDQTVVSIPLNKPILPRKSAKFLIEFETKLPKVVARTGYMDDYYLIGQWFPKIGVYEPAGMRFSKSGEWNCHQFHANSEFYANFGNYEVEITLPKKFIVGATGKLVKEEQKENSRKTLTYLAEDVVDFAWTACPRFSVYNSAYKNVDIKIYTLPQHRERAVRHQQAVTKALEYFEKYLGKYPYPSISIVVPPINAMQSGGMEYPMFITTIDVWGLPDSVRFPEMTTIHEFGHQYFMGLLATNEAEEAWLDEGFNSYFEARIADWAYGSKTSIIDYPGFRLGDGEMQRAGFMSYPNSGRAQIDRKSWEYVDGGYGIMTYQKTAIWLFTMEGILGKETMDEIMKTYYDRWKFDHPCRRDFENVANEIITKNYGGRFGENFNWFFTQMLDGTEKCDYKVQSISNSRIKKSAGKFDWEVEDEIPAGEKMYKSKVRFYRAGGVQLPVDVLIHFENGEDIVKQWDGKSRVKSFEFETPDKIQWAKIDPHFKIKVDSNLLNNSLTSKTRRLPVLKYAQKLFFLLQNVMLSFALLF